VNVVCDNALIGGFAAQVRPVSRSIVLEVMRDFDLTSDKTVQPARNPDPVVVASGEPDPDLASDLQMTTTPPEQTGGRLIGPYKKPRRFSFFSS
jgi:hypothetical protein